jgi:hypothetical protein
MAYEGFRKNRRPDYYRVFEIAKTRDDDGNQESTLPGVDRKLNSGAKSIIEESTRETKSLSGKF